MNQLNEEYENIKASDCLKKRVDGIMKKEMANRKIKRGFATAAGIFVLCVASLNLYPPIALAAEKVPVLSSIVKVLTLNRYEFKADGYEATVVTPRIEGLLNPQTEEKLNLEFADYANTIIRFFESDMAALEKASPTGGAHMQLEADYVVLTDNDNILALNFYVFSAEGSSETVNRFYTIDKRTGNLLTLSQLFDGDYVEPVSAYIAEEIKRRNAQENAAYDTDEMGFSQIAPEQSFYINPKNQLVVCFDKYEIAAGVEGNPEFVIPKTVLADIAAFDILK